MDYVPIIFISAKTGQRVDQVMPMALRVQEERLVRLTTSKLNDVLTKINAARSGRNPILVIPVAYGGDADIASLNSIAQASSTKVQSGDPKNIQNLLEIISSYF